MRLPATLPAAAIHRVVCDGCHQSFDAPPELLSPTALSASQIAAAAAPGDSSPESSADPQPTAGPGRDWLAVPRDALWSLWDGLLDGRDALAERAGRLPRPNVGRARLWTWASVPLAALGVVAGLALLQGDSGGGSSTAATIAPKGARAGGEAKFIQGPGYSLALPAGWKQVDPPDGAAFAAESKNGLADATLWISDDGKLSFRQFEQRSLAQLEEIGDNARIADRVQGPTIESMITELRADAPVADGVSSPIRVTLRGAGDYRLFFSSAEQPGAGAQTAAEIETMHASLRPDVAVEGLGDGS